MTSSRGGRAQARSYSASSEYGLSLDAFLRPCKTTWWRLLVQPSITVTLDGNPLLERLSTTRLSLGRSGEASRRW